MRLLKIKGNSAIQFCEYCGSQYLINDTTSNNSRKKFKKKYASLINNKRAEIDKKSQLNGKTDKELEEELIKKILRYNRMSDKEKEEFDKSSD